MYRNLAMSVAIDGNRAIGKNGKLLCHLKADIDHFIDITRGCILVTGRKNHESIQEKWRPLPEREEHIVLTRNLSYNAPGYRVLFGAEQILDMAEKNPEKKIWIIGGGEIYKIFMPYASKMVITTINTTFDGCDTFFPELVGEWMVRFLFQHSADKDNQFPFHVHEYNRV